MRILHIVPSYLPAIRYGGPIYSVHGLCRALAALGHDVHVFTTPVDGAQDSGVPLEQPVNLDGVLVWYFPSCHLRRLCYSPSMLRMLRQQTNGFDLVHLHSVFLWPTWAAARLARRNNIPYILTPRGMLVKELVRRKSRWVKTCWIRLIEQRNLERAALVHLTSTKEAEELKKFSFQLSRTTVLPNGVDPPSVWTPDELSEDVRQVVRQPGYVLSLSRVSWKKGLDRLLHVWKEVPDARLIIAGNDEEGYLPRLHTLVVEQQIGDRVTFLARSIFGADKEALFAAARLFILPSYSENFGNTVLEAMIRGIPVLVTKEVGAAEIVAESGGGKVIKARHLAQELSAILNDPEKLQSMGQCGHQYISGRYGWEQIASQMECVYREIVKR